MLTAKEVYMFVIVGNEKKLKDRTRIRVYGFYS